MNTDKPLERNFTFVFEEVPAFDGGGYVAYAKELPGAISEGDSLEEARENLQDAIALLLDCQHNKGR